MNLTMPACRSQSTAGGRQRPYRNTALRDGARTSTRTSSVAKGRAASIHCRPAPPRQTEVLSLRTSRSRPLKTSQPSGARLGTVSERIAHTVVSQAAIQAHAWIDLHGGDIHEALVPVVGYLEEGEPGVRQRARAMAEVFGIEHVM